MIRQESLTKYQGYLEEILRNEGHKINFAELNRRHRVNAAAHWYANKIGMIKIEDGKLVNVFFKHVEPKTARVLLEAINKQIPLSRLPAVNGNRREALIAEANKLASMTAVKPAEPPKAIRPKRKYTKRIDTTAVVNVAPPVVHKRKYTKRAINTTPKKTATAIKRKKDGFVFRLFDIIPIFSWKRLR